MKLSRKDLNFKNPNSASSRDGVPSQVSIVVNMYTQNVHSSMVQKFI